MNIEEIKDYLERHRILEEFMPEKPHPHQSHRIPAAGRKTEPTLITG